MNNFINYESPDNVYYNIIIPGKDNQEVLARYESTRLESIIDNPCDYYLSVVRFQVPGDTIPMVIFKIQEGILQTDINLSTMSFTLSFGGFDEQTFLEYFTTGINRPLPKAPSDNNGVQDITPYYFIFNMWQYIEILNTALKKCIDDFNTAHPGVLPVDYDIDLPPYFRWDPETKKFKFIVQRSFVDNNIQLFVNTALHQYLDTITRIDFYGFDQSFGKDFLLHFKIDPVFPQADNAYNTVLYPALGPVYDALNVPTLVSPVYPYPNPIWLEYTQESSKISFIYSFRKLVFITNHLPIRRELTPSRNQLNDPFGGEGINNSTPILTDFEPDLNVLSGDLREYFTYFADGRYRLVDMCNNAPLKKIDLQIFWSDNENNLYPLTIFPQNQVSVKLIFLKKSLEKNI